MNVSADTLENVNPKKRTRSKKDDLKKSKPKSEASVGIPSDVDFENTNPTKKNLKLPEPENVTVDSVANPKINATTDNLENEYYQKRTRSKKDVDLQNINPTNKNLKPPEPEIVTVDSVANPKFNASRSKHGKSSTFDNVQELVDKSDQGANKRKSNDEIEESDSPEQEITKKRARKVNFPELSSTSSRSTRSKRVVDDVLETPKKRSKAKTDTETPTQLSSLHSSTSDISTPDRNRRKQKPKVVFTMLDSPELESVIRSLGGTIVNSVETSTVLVTGSLKRTPKLLSAIGLSKPICSPKWLQECKKANQFLDPWDYVLEDPDAENNWNMSLKESLIKSRTQKLFQNCTVYIAATNSIDALKAAVESCGGKCVTKAPARITNQNFVIVANLENKTKYSKFLNREPPIKVVKPEAILDGVMRQELRFEEYLLS